MSADILIKIDNLKKTFQGGLEALKGVNLEIQRGEILALLGPNGAGKTTLINAICGIVLPTSGTISVDGYDVVKDFRKTRSMIGLVPQELHLEAFEKVFQNVSYTRGLYGKKKDPAYIEKILKDLSLWDKKDSKLRELSGGMKKRALIAKALSHEPKILFLDEPTAVVDINLRRDMWRAVKELKENGVTIILTTQYLEEADELADRLAIIDEGLVVAEGTSDELKASIGGDVITFSFENDSDLKNAKNVLNDAIEDKDQLRITVENGAAKIPSFINDLNKNGIIVSSVSASKPTLDDVFLEVTGYRLEGSAGTDSSNELEVK